MANRFQNFYTTTLTTDIGANDDTIRVNTPPTDLVRGTLTLEARNPDKREIIKFTGVNDNLLTGVIRGAEGTRATTHNRNASVEMNITAGMLNEAFESQSNLTEILSNKFSNMIFTGLDVSKNSGTTYTLGSGVLYLSGQRIEVEHDVQFTFTNNRDVALDIDINGNISKIEATLGFLPKVKSDKFRLWSAGLDSTKPNNEAWVIKGNNKAIGAKDVAFSTFSAFRYRAMYPDISGYVQAPNTNVRMNPSMVIENIGGFTKDASGIITVPVTGFYSINANATISDSPTTLAVMIVVAPDGTNWYNLTAEQYGANLAVNRGVAASGVAYLQAGGMIECRTLTYGSAGNTRIATGNTNIIINLIQRLGN